MTLPWARLLAKRRTAPAVVPAGMRIYAIGDIHGRADLLDDLAESIGLDLASSSAQALAIFLGDYVDRGADSAGVVERLSNGDFPAPFCALRGNHEEVLMQFLDDESVLESWRKFGGLETLYSYGVDVGEAMRGRGYEAARRSFLEKFPARHRRFLEQTALSVSHGDYFFCHAGARPAVPLEAQSPNDLLWIRDEFLGFRGSWEKIVVHGHTPVPAPDIRANRINIDTGAFATSILTALVLEGDSRRLIFAGGRPAAFR